MYCEVTRPLAVWGTPSGGTVLAVHLYAEHKLDALLHKIGALIELADEVWLSSMNDCLLEKAERLLATLGKDLRFFHVGNQWHDWSGYLAFLHAADLTSRMIVCNDSIVTRRVIGNKTLGRFINAFEVEGPAMIGEVDTAKCSVDLNGWSSVCWVSTYLFAIQGLTVDVPQLVASVEADVDGAVSDPDHFFRYYLNERRADVVIGDENMRAKLGAMFFERRLTRLTIESGLQIVDFCAGSLTRKIERVFERSRDA